MTSINTSSRDSLIAEFKKLPVDDQIAALGFIYQEIGGSLPSLTMSPSKQVEDVVKAVSNMREGGQIQFLQDVLTDTDRDEIALDINPSKAMLELIPGDGVEPPIEEYEKLSANDRLMVWYQLASKMGDDFITMPSDYKLSEGAQTILKSINELGAEDKISFMSQIV